MCLRFAQHEHVNMYPARWQLLPRSFLCTYISSYLAINKRSYLRFVVWSCTHMTLARYSFVLIFFWLKFFIVSMVNDLLMHIARVEA